MNWLKRQDKRELTVRGKNGGCHAGITAQCGGRWMSCRIITAHQLLAPSRLRT